MCRPTLGAQSLASSRPDSSAWPWIPEFLQECENGKYEAVKDVVEGLGETGRRCDPQQWHSVLCSGLHNAIRGKAHACADVLRCLEAAGADLKALDSDARTPLMAAAASNNSAALKFLLHCLGPQHVNEQSPADGSTALHYAAYHGAYECVGLLLAAGANKEVYTLCGKTPCDLALKPKRGYSHKGLVQLLAPRCPALPADAEEEQQAEQAADQQAPVSQQQQSQPLSQEMLLLLLSQQRQRQREQQQLKRRRHQQQQQQQQRHQQRDQESQVVAEAAGVEEETTATKRRKLSKAPVQRPELLQRQPPKPQPPPQPRPLQRQQQQQPAQHQQQQHQQPPPQQPPIQPQQQQLLPEPVLRFLDGLQRQQLQRSADARLPQSFERNRSQNEELATLRAIVAAYLASWEATAVLRLLAAAAQAGGAAAAAAAAVGAATAAAGKRAVMVDKATNTEPWWPPIVAPAAAPAAALPAAPQQAAAAPAAATAMAAAASKPVAAAAAAASPAAAAAAVTCLELAHGNQGHAAVQHGSSGLEVLAAAALQGSSCLVHLPSAAASDESSGAVYDHRAGRDTVGASR